MTAGAQAHTAAFTADIPFEAVLSRCLIYRDLESGRRYAIMAEPTHDGLAAQRAAEAAIIRVWETLREFRHLELTETASRALANAHATVRKANILPGGQRRSELGLVGMSLCLSDGQEMVIALAAPAQALILQDDQVFPIPSFDLRKIERGFADPPESSLPLGGAIFQPALYSTRIEPGDRVMLCSEIVARSLAHLAEQYPGRLQTRLSDIMRLEPAHAEPMLRELLGSERSNLLAVYAPADPLTSDGDVLQTVVRNEPSPARSTMSARSGAVSPDGGEAGKRAASGTTAPVLASDGMAPIAPLSSDVFARHVRQHSPLRESLRVWVPRGPWEAIPLWSIGLVILIALAFGGGARWYQAEQQRQSQADAHLAEADLQLSTLGISSDQDVLRAQVVAAEQALQAARENGATDEELAARQVALVEGQDRINGINRLENVQVVGQIPLEPLEGLTAQIVRAGDHIYLVYGTVYRIDRANGQLVQMIEPGVKTDRVTPGTILDATAEGSMLIATDGKSIFKLQDLDVWDAKRLGLLEENTPWRVTGVGSFGGAWYLLNGEAGSIFRFNPETLDQAPTDWTEGAHRDLISGAVDFVIDGSIYIITSDNRFEVLYRGEAQAVENPPALQSPVAIYGGIDTAYIWVLELRDGIPTILRIERGTYETITFQVPFDWNTGAGLDDLSNVRDFVVLENRGEVILVTDTQIWQAFLPQT
jgi:hypothetical protein